VKPNTEKYIRNHVRNILKEIFDYKEKDIDEMDDVYTGAVYVHSKTPLTLSDLKKHETIPARMHNRADASDVDSEYIYRLKTRKPLFKKERSSMMGFLDDYDFDPFDENPTPEKERKSKKPTMDSEDFSGYFAYHSTFQELYATIKTKDIVEFKLIGGFVKYDKNVPGKLNIEVSDKTDSFLYSYISGAIKHESLTPEIFEELKKFKPTVPTKIYKGIEEVQMRHYSESKPPYKLGQIITINFPHMSSWSTNPLIARRFIDEYPSSPPFVVEMVAQPENMVVDVQMLPKEYYHTNQREIIMNQGQYTFKIVWERKLDY
jgi:hypothetical protein